MDVTVKAELMPLGSTSPPELATIANTEHDLARSSADASVGHALRAGEALLAVKAQLAHGDWLPWLAANFSASERMAQRYMTIAGNPTRVADLDAPELSLRAVLKRLERIEREEDADRRRAEEPSLLALPSAIDIRDGDLRTALDDLAGTVDAIITDPPYPAKFLDEYDALGELAVKILKPTGILVAMVGQTHLPAYVKRLSAHLDYRWCGAYLTDGPATRIHGRKVGTKWKPLLIFGGERFITQDVLQSRGDDKEHHHWGQSESGMAAIIDSFTIPGELVVDPFLGGGTTAVVCRDLGRRFAGCDIDSAATSIARERLAA